MNIVRHYTGNCTDEEIKILENRGMEFEEVYSYGKRQLVVIDVFKGSDDEQFIIDELPQFSFIISWYIFSDEEMDAAEWFTARSTNSKFECCKEHKTFRFSCPAAQVFGRPDFEFYMHREQIGSFYFNKPVKWGRNHFYSCKSGGFEALFCDDFARSIIDNNLKGASFLPVLSSKNGRELENIHQLTIDTILPTDTYSFIEERGQWTCPLCGKKKYITDALSRLRVDKRVLGELDFYSSGTIDTTDVSVSEGEVVIISKRAYELFKKYNFDRTLELFPLITY